MVYGYTRGAETRFESIVETFMSLIPSYHSLLTGDVVKRTHFCCFAEYDV